MKDPPHYARWVRRVHGMENAVPINVDMVAAKCGIPIYEDRFTGFLGLWLHVGDREGIVLAEGQMPRRRRFTLAHEIGHACLPTHRKAQGLKCLEDDLSEADTDPGMEAEANAFAAELLAPKRLITPILATGAVSIRKADEIADQFDVSLTSAVRRVVEYGKQPAAMVLSEGGHIRWCLRRNGFPYGLPASGQKIPGGTVARDIQGGGTNSIDPKGVESVAWLPDSSGRITMMESAIRLGALDQVLSLLWIPDLEPEGPDETS